jgi:short-subunit dehydrogenase
MGNLKNQPSIAVVGAGEGMGEAIAARFGQEGFHCILIARNAAHLAPIAERLRAQSISCECATADASDGAALGALLQGLAAGHYLSVLAYNVASFQPMGVPSKLNLTALDASVRASATNALAAAQAVLGAMRVRGNGSLLFTGGGYALQPAPAMAALGMGKAALRNLVFSLHHELKAEGIHAATVTIRGQVTKGGDLDPARIAEHYWQLHLQKPADFEWERTVGG